MLERLRVLLAFATVAAVALSVSARAQQAPEAAPGAAGRHHEALYEVMNDMTREMRQMMEQMAQGEVPAEQRNGMARRMEQMSSMMQRMSGLLARPAMKEPEFRAQMERIGRTSDPAERARLLREHGQTMRENVRAMRAVDDPFTRAMRSMMVGGKRAVSSEAMMKAHALIARRIALMDRMMGQMMEQLMRHQESSEKP